MNNAIHSSATCGTSSHIQNEDARPLLPKASFFLGDVYDGLPMINMSSVFLVSNCNYTEKQVGILFLSFGLARAFTVVPAGYVLDYSRHKVAFVAVSALMLSALTVIIPLVADKTDGGVNSDMSLQLVLHAMQGAMSAVLPPAFNAITLGITGQSGLTHQVSRNRMMNHMGTAALVGISCVTAYYSYPNFEVLFFVSPIAAAVAVYFCCKIPSASIHRDAARGLVFESPTMNEYVLAEDVAACKMAAFEIMVNDSECEQQDQVAMQKSDSCTELHMDQYDPQPFDSSTRRATSTSSSNSMLSFRFGCNDLLNRREARENAMNENNNNTAKLKARTPAQVLANPILATFVVVIFFFHLANCSVLPLVMQSLALKDPQAGILLSGLCILIAQTCMAFIARWCGDLSTSTGRKPLVMLGLASLTLRCFLLTVLNSAEDWFVERLFSETVEEQGMIVLKILILCTQLLDSVGAGILGTLQILVTSDIAGGSGRFSLVLGVTTASMCLGATVSGYLGQAVAQDYGYEWAFTALGVISLIPLVLYGIFMPETLPDFKPAQRHRQQRLREWLRRRMSNSVHENEHITAATALV